MSTTSYPEHRRHIQGWIRELRRAAPDAMAGFRDLHHGAMSAGRLDTKTKELIALGIAISTHCESCIAFHVHDALQAGASRDEIVEAIAVAVLLGGGPSMMYGAQALEAVDQFEEVS